MSPRIKRIRDTGIIFCLVFFVTGLGHGEVLVRDDFTSAQSGYDFIGGRVWKIGGGVCRFATIGQERYAIVNLDELNEARVEATLTITKRLSPRFVTAGLTFYQDAENHWRLLLVASPQDRPYCELVERYNGTHQAQSAPPSAGTRLAGKTEGELTSWEYGKPYRLILTIRDKEIIGEVRDPATGKFWRGTYSFATGRAVRSGRPGMTANDTEGTFQNLVVEGVPPAPLPALPTLRGPTGSVAILQDEKGALAPALKNLFDKAGFGTTIVNWDDLDKSRLPAENLDLFVLPDARQLPAIAVKRSLSFLRARGKLIAIGAPAFGEILVKSTVGYVPAEKYQEIVYTHLNKRIIPLKANAWTRNAKNPKQTAKIEPMPDVLHAWKVSADLEGWDSFGQRMENVFSPGHDLLCFRARGDEQTPQFSIECRERDGARWIATVELSTDWRVYVLRPRDFPYWHDSKGKRGPGAVMNPANVTDIYFGLSGSHTPKCKPGPHTFWVADVATAADTQCEAQDFRVPNIEALCPSYKLYPLWETAYLQYKGSKFPFTGKGYSPVWREGGIGFDRERLWRWVRVVDAYDAAGRNRGALVSLVLGESVFPGAIWANVGLAEPAQVLQSPLQEVLLATAKAMTRGCFLLEGGTRYFSYYPGEKMELGALVMNAGRREETLRVSITISTAVGKQIFEKVAPVKIPPSKSDVVRGEWTPPTRNETEFPYIVTTRLYDAKGDILDTISHTVDLLPDKPAKPDEFVKVEGSNFILGGKPWYMLGINYRPTSQAGNSMLGQHIKRECYDPAVIERDLSWMESIGINMLSAIHAYQPDDPAAAPAEYRDLLDFLNRCRKHGMKVFYFLPWGNPMAGGDVEKIKKHIEAAGIKDHPAILAWELAWEPIYYAGPVRKGNMEFLTPDWNAWIEERYGSLDDAEKDWGVKLERTEKGLAALPKREWCESHGEWDRAVAAFRRFFSDRVGRGYGEIIRELHRWDPKHLVTFRFGACGIPDKARFAHAHSATVAKHVDFMCPEGYNLQTGGWATPTPPDNIRKGGLVTLYYRFISREKPTVWMEFGFTVNGYHTQWKTGLEHIKPDALAHQRAEYECFYKMFIESGARGAAPWWLPGGFRLGENSDFGVLEPDGTERPCCEVMKEYLPKFAQVKPGTCVASSSSQGPVILLDFDAHYADAWTTYSDQYLDIAKKGHVPLLKTEGTGTTSADCPLLAVGNTPCNGKNPPKFLNAEFNSIEVKVDEGEWREVRRGEVFAAKKGAKIMCRASVGNTEEATWLAPGAQRLTDTPEPGFVYLRCELHPSGGVLHAPIASHTPYLKDAEVKEFAVPHFGGTEQKIVFQMIAIRQKPGTNETLTIPFGEKRTILVKTEGEL